MIMYKNAKGFTFVELIVATVILAIVVAGVYAAFLTATKFTGTFKHKVMAVIGTQGILESVRAANRCEDLTTGSTDVTTSPLLDPLESEVATTNFSGTQNVTENVDLGSAANGYPFTRITITVQWDEREI